MIKSFRHKGLAELFHTGKSAKVQPKQVKRLKIILLALNSAENPGEMAMPGMRFHPLRNVGRYAIWVDENYRVTFAFERQDTTGVDYEDYH